VNVVGDSNVTDLWAFFVRTLGVYVLFVLWSKAKTGGYLTDKAIFLYFVHTEFEGMVRVIENLAFVVRMIVAVTTGVESS